MPHRYTGHRLPATLYAYPFDYLVTVVLIAAGVVINLAPSAAPASIRDLPEAWSVIFRIMCLLGGVLVALGLGKDRHKWSFVTEITGMCLAAGVFGAYSVSLVFGIPERPGGALGAVLLVGLSLVCLIRALALGIESDYRLQMLQEAGKLQRENDQ